MLSERIELLPRDYVNQAVQVRTNLNYGVVLQLCSMATGPQRVALEEGSNTNTQVLDLITIFELIEVNLAVLPSQPLRASFRPRLVAFLDA